MNGKDFDGDDEFNIIHSIDFNKPGVYVVEIKRTEDLKCSFAIEVIENQWCSIETQNNNFATKNSTTNSPSDVGLVMQKFGMMTPYNIKVSFSTTY